MGYKAKDENLFNKKNKITLDRYNKLRSDYDDVIKNYNGINLIIDNPTATGYPYSNTKQQSTFIEKKYRDKKYLSFKNESNFSCEFTEHGTYEFDIPKGYYEVTMLSAGSGGFAIYGSGLNKYAQYPGCSGSMYKLIIYIPSTGHMKVEVGKGGQRFIRNDAYTGKYHRESPVVDGGNTYVYFNNALIATCRGGGRLQYVFRTHNHDGDIEGIGIFDSKNVNKLGSFILETLDFKDNIYDVGSYDQCDKGHTKQMGWNYLDQTNFPNNGVGGCAWANPGNPPRYNDDTLIKEYTQDGKDGYFKLAPISSSFYDYLIEGINVETTKIHTLGNENEIRRKFNEALEKMYNKLSITDQLVRDTCSVIGEKTNEETTCEPYSDIALEERPYNFVEIKTNGNAGKLLPNGALKKDLYAITYDFNQKRKLTLRDYSDFLENSMSEEIFTPFKYGSDIIYVKGIPNKTTNVDVYKFEDNKFIKQSTSGRYIKGEIINWKSSTASTKNITLTDNAYVTITLVGAGGGGGGGSGGKRWYKSGSGGGSGGLIKGIYRGTKNQTLFIKIGSGGEGGNFTQKGPGHEGHNGVSSTFTVNNEVIMEAGAGGGGGGTTKHGSSGHTPCGLRGVNTCKREKLTRLLTDTEGNGNTPTDDSIREQKGMMSVYMDSEYGAGGMGGYNGNHGNNSEKKGFTGKDGYAELYIQCDSKLMYNNHEYEVSEEEITTSNVILWADYLYDLQKLNRLKEYVSMKDSWFDSDGYCQRSCQINCQTKVQKS